MRILSFQVEGYKNLRDVIRLDSLSPVTAIYGPNNIGKSNLIESMALLFVLLGLDESEPLPFNNPASLSGGHMTDVGYPLGEIFTLGAPSTIRLQMAVEVEAEGLVAAGIDPLLPTSPLSVSLEIEPGPPKPTWQVTRFESSDGTDVRRAATPEQLAFVKKLSLYLSRNYLIGGGGGQRKFQVLDVNRSRPVGLRGIVPQDLKSALYDHQESEVQALASRWTLFQKMFATFDDVTGSGDIRAVFNRKTSEANLVLQTADSRIPVHLLGTGVQQIIVLLGALATSGATIAAIEEPEANLAFRLQVRLRELIHQLPTMGGPSQIFYTSHSPELLAGDSFLEMRAGAHGPEVLRRAARDVAAVTGVAEGALPTPRGRAPQAWVTEDGLLRLPPHVQAGLDLPHGGGVAFFELEDGTFQLVTDAQALKALGWDQA